MEYSLFKWIQKWYLSQCDGDWEHQYGIRIDTLDNPGWLIKIDIIKLEFNKAIKNVLIEKSDDDWFAYEIKDNCFIASGDSNKLEFLLQLFKNFAELGEISLPYEQ
jgi:hypothetical protein